jgi:uncharacterized protein (DUF433 family)
MERAMTTAPVIKEHIEIVDGAGGPKAVIAGHRVRVIDIVAWHEKLGLSVDEILTDYVPTITRADIYAALAYYWDHRDEIEQRIAEENRIWEQGRREPSLLQERIADRQSHAPQVPA